MHVATTAPLPRLDQWPALLFGATGDDHVIARPWLLDGDRPLWLSRAAWGLAAVVRAMAERLGRPPNLWLPDFFCNQAIGPCRAVGASASFYPIDETLRPDWESCSVLAQRGKPDLFVLVHYFGFPVETGEARAFCDRVGAAMIEDAAHVLRPTGDVGAAADFVLYSLYKHLPAPDGGLLIVRPRAQAMANEIEAARHASALAAPRTGSWIAKRFCQGLAGSLIATRGGSQSAEFDDDPDLPDLLQQQVALSNLARRAIASLGDQLDTVAARRCANERKIREIFEGVEGLTPLFPPPVQGVVPYRAVLRARDHGTARRWYRRIRESGNVVETWPDLAPEVKTAPARHPVALGLRNTLLGLPIHADRSPEELGGAYGAAL